MKYTVIEARKIQDLIKLVNSDIKDGWKPQGGVCLSPKELDIRIGRHGDEISSYIYIQAMVKDEI